MRKVIKGQGNFPPLNVLYEHLPVLQEGACCVRVYHHIPIFTHILVLSSIIFARFSAGIAPLTSS